MTDTVKTPSKKSRRVAFWLCLLGGIFGLHNFYVGRIVRGIVFSLTLGLFFIGIIVDLIKIVTGSYVDVSKAPLISEAEYIKKEQQKKVREMAGVSQDYYLTFFGYLKKSFKCLSNDTPLTLNMRLEWLELKTSQAKDKDIFIFKIPYEKIIDVELTIKKEITQKKKRSMSGALIGGMLLGDAGAAVGAATSADDTYIIEKVKEIAFLEIKFETDNGEESIILETTWSAFTARYFKNALQKMVNLTYKKGQGEDSYTDPLN